MTSGDTIGVSGDKEWAQPLLQEGILARPVSTSTLLWRLSLWKRQKRLKMLPILQVPACCFSGSGVRAAGQWPRCLCFAVKRRKQFAGCGLGDTKLSCDNF